MFSNREEIEEKILLGIDSLIGEKKPKKKKKHSPTITENDVQMQVITWLKQTYPNVLFKCDGTTGMKMSIGMAMKQKRLGGIIKDFPDFCLYKINKLYSGLFLEIKRPEIKIYQENGEYYKNEHHIAQSAMLARLTNEGYAASFGIGYEHCKTLIEAYLNDDYEVFDQERIV